jgi:Mn-dependent DtxR family transcriptional regulator
MVLSTCSKERQTIFEILIENDGFLKTSQIVEILDTTRPTALKTMTELKATGLVTMYDVNPN